jgi:rRNA maturation RNase YbeY
MNILETDTLTVSSNGTLPSVPFLELKDKILGKRYTLSISFVPPKVAQELNVKHRNKDYIPNTLSFPLTKTTGEIILCLSAIKKEYKTFDMRYEQYLLYIIIHSMLHLKGYDHGSTMERKEMKLLNDFSPSIPHEASIKRRH